MYILKKEYNTIKIKYVSKKISMYVLFTYTAILLKAVSFSESVLTSRFPKTSINNLDKSVPLPICLYLKSSFAPSYSKSSASWNFD